MATRVNTKFVLILSATVIASGGILAGLWVLHVRGDTTRHITAGNEMMADGDYERAFKEYGRAVSKEPANLAHLDKVEGALLKIRPATRDQANEFESMRQEILRHRTRYRPRDPEAHMAYIMDVYTSARWFDRTERWSELASAAEEMWQRVPADEPNRDLARLYRGIAQTRLLAPRTAREDEIQAAERDLREYLAAHPDSDRGWAALLLWQYTFARQLSTEVNTRPAELKFKELDETMAEALEAVPDGPEVATVHTLSLAQKRTRLGDAAVSDEELAAAVDRMMELATKTDDPLILLDAVGVIRTAHPEHGLARGIDMLQAYVDAHPTRYYEMYTLAALYYAKRDHEKVIELCDTIIEAEPMPVGPMSRVQYTLRVRAASLIVDAEYVRWDAAAADEKAAQLERVVEARDHLASLLAEPETEPALMKADGRIAFARKDFATAAAKFERLLKLQPTTEDVQVLWYAALSLEQVSQIGLALERIKQATEIQPTNTALLADRARFEFLVGQYDEAQRTVSVVLQIAPNNALAKRLRTTIESARRGMQKDDDADPVARAITEAKTAMDDRDLDGAHALLTDALDENPGSLPLLAELLRIELRRGETEAAREYLAQALEIQPENQYLQRVEASLHSDDQIEALKSYMAGLYEDEADRAVHTMILLQGLAGEMDKKARIAERRDNADAAAQDRQSAERARAEALAQRQLAESIAPGHPLLVEHLFKAAISEGDWQTAQAMVKLAQEGNADQADGLIFKGRYEMAREDLNAAVQTLTEATARKHYSALAWRLLGRCQEHLGQFDEALRSYERSYQCNPNDRFGVRAYANLLVQTGERAKALRVLRGARRTIQGDHLLREVRLQLEAEVGNLRTAIEERRRMYNRSPKNRLNAIRLAALLGKSKPTYDFLRNARNEPIYDADSWRLLLDEERRSLIAGVTEEWIAESEAILDELATGGEDTIEMASLRAELLQARGEIAAGEQLLKDYIERNRDEPSAKEYIVLGRYQSAVNQLEDAIASFLAAREFQDPEIRLADHALGDFYFDRNQWDEAYQVYHDLYAAEALNDAMRLVECCVKLGRFEEADAALMAAVEDLNQDFTAVMLKADIARGLGDQLYDQGRSDEAEARYDEELAALNRAEQLRPASPLPHVRRAGRLVKQFERTGRKAFLDDALLLLERADDIAAGAEATSVMRVDILRKLGDTRAATGELARLIEKNPDNASARRLLVQLYFEGENYKMAFASLQEAIDRNPTVAFWHEMKGDLYVVTNRVPEAVAAFRETYRLQPTKNRLSKLMETMLNPPPAPEGREREKPDYEGVVALATGDGQADLVANPFARAFYAEALVGIDDLDGAMDQMRTAYAEHAELAERFPDARLGILRWYQALQRVYAGREPAELEQFVRELTMDDPDAVALHALARSWVVLDPETGMSRAIELAQAALDQFPDEDPRVRLQIYLDLGSFQVEAADFAAAVTSFEGALRIDPNNALALNNVAYLYVEMLDEAEKAVPFARRAAEARPGDPSILDTLGWCYARVGDYDAAEEPLRRAIEINPTADNHYHLAWVLARTDETQKAEIYLRRAAELRPGDDVRAKIERLAQELNSTLDR